MITTVAETEVEIEKGLATPRAGKGATTGAGVPGGGQETLPGTEEDQGTLPGTGEDRGIGRGTPETGITRGLREIATGGTADLQETGKGGHVTGIPAEIVMTTEEGHVIEGEADPETEAGGAETDDVINFLYYSFNDLLPCIC